MRNAMFMMQFLFLAYHYWKAEFAYQDIRCYITCHLWMTGYGNMQFFFAKRDFSFLRVLQMLWRMNFFCFFLCLTMDNPYLVYYICPLHTFFFFITYLLMGVMQSENLTKWGLSAKIVILAVLLWIVYDVPNTGIFHVMFGWLGTTPTQASIGSHRHWYGL